MSIFTAKSHIPVALGTASIVGNNADTSKAIKILKASFDSGLRIYDTAPMYGKGQSERCIGMALKEKRQDVFLISKSGLLANNNKVVLTNDPTITKQMLEQSLHSLQTDYIDLYMIHWPDPRVDIRKPFEVLAKAKSEGKIRHIGLCNTTVTEIEKASQVHKVEVVQSQFSFTHPHNELFDYLKEKQIDFMSWGTLDKGFIVAPPQRNSIIDKIKTIKNLSKYKRMNQIFNFLEEQGHSGIELALGYNLLHSLCPICGVSSIDQLDSLIRAKENLPKKEIIEKAFEIFHGINSYQK